MVKENDIIQIALSLMSCMFEWSTRTTKITIAYRCVCMTTLLTLAVLTVYNFFKVKDEVILRNLETFITEFHVIQQIE